MQYKMNLNGIHINDIVQCSNGDRFRIESVYRGVIDDHYAKGVLLRNGELGAFKDYSNKIFHSESGNNCWKFYTV